MTPFERLGVLLNTEILDALDKAIPPRCLQRGESVEDHLRYAGQRELVEALRAKYEEAQENSLSPSSIKVSLS